MVHVAAYHALDQVEMLSLHAHHAVLVNDEETQLVTEVEHGGRSGIVRTAYRIETVFLELQELVTPQLIRHSGTDTGMVEMKVAALELDAVSVEKESFTRIEVRRTDTYPDVILVKKTLDAVIVLVQASPERIEIRGIHGPESRRGNLKLHHGTVRIREGRSDGTAVGIEQGLGHQIPALRREFVHEDLGNDRAYRPGGIETVLLQSDSVRFYGRSTGLVEIDVPVDAGTFVIPSFL